MNAKTVNLSKLRNNQGQIEGLPANPKFIKDEKYKKLKKSIQADPEMMALRELIAYDTGSELVVICGNMRLRALRELKYKETPVKILPSDTPSEKLRAYTVKDNVEFGEADFDMLANEWDVNELNEWGMDLPALDETESEERMQDKKAVMKITFPSLLELAGCEQEISSILSKISPSAVYSIKVN